MSASSKREASRRCLLKKQAEKAKLTPDEFSEMTYKVPAAVYVTDEFQGKLKGKPIPAESKKEEPEPEQAPPASSKGQTVAQFVDAFCGTDSKRAKSIKAEIGKKVLAEAVSYGGNDMYLADILNVNLEVINGAI